MSGVRCGRPPIRHVATASSDGEQTDGHGSPGGSTHESARRSGRRRAAQLAPASCGPPRARATSVAGGTAMRLRGGRNRRFRVDSHAGRVSRNEARINQRARVLPWARRGYSRWPGSPLGSRLPRCYSTHRSSSPMTRSVTVPCLVRRRCPPRTGRHPVHFPELGHGSRAGLSLPDFCRGSPRRVLRPVLGRAGWSRSGWCSGARRHGGALLGVPGAAEASAAGLFLANPFMVEAVLLGQLPFLWATAPWFVAVGIWRRDAGPGQRCSSPP